MAEVREQVADEHSTSAALAETIMSRSLTHLVGQTRAYVLLVEGHLAELRALHDERASRVVEALSMTTAQPARPGTLRHLEVAASELLRALSSAAITT